MTLPIAVASDGPAITLRPMALAVNWLSRRFFEPPPMMCKRSIGKEATRSKSSNTSRYFKARLSKIRRITCASFSGLGWPVRSQNASMACNMEGGLANEGSSEWMYALDGSEEMAISTIPDSCNSCPTIPIPYGIVPESTYHKCSSRNGWYLLPHLRW